MIKKALIATVISVVLVSVVAVGMQALHKKPPSRPIQHHVVAKPTPTLKPWDGTLSRILNITFIRAGQLLDLQSIDYAGMDTTEATVTMNWVITPANNATQEPSWLDGASAPFVIQSTQQKRGQSGLGVVSYAGKVSAIPNGEAWDVTSTFSVPTSGLAVTCQGTQSAPLGVTVNGPDGVFVLGLLPPPAPTGYCFAKYPAPAPPVAPKKRRARPHGAPHASRKTR